MPVARVVDVVVCEDQVPWDLKGEVAGVLRGMEQVKEFAYAIGREHKPRKPLMIYGPDNDVPIYVVGDGVTEASEMEDLALAALDKQATQIKKTGRAFDFDEARERAGMVRREDFQQAWHDAFEQKAKKMKANWRTRNA